MQNEIYAGESEFAASVSAFFGQLPGSNTFLKELFHKHFNIAGITVRIESEFDISNTFFKDELQLFAVDKPNHDLITFRHFFTIPDLLDIDMGEEVYYKHPWAIYKNKDLLLYKGILPNKSDGKLHHFAIFRNDYRFGYIYNPPKYVNIVRKSKWQSLSLFPSDQIWLCPILAERDAILLHSAGAIINNKGLVFVGHSTAGKSTTMEQIKENNKKIGYNFEILCDDRNIIRKWPGEWRVHGTWSHGTTTDVSPSSAPLQAILFLKKSTNNRLIRLDDKKYIWKHLLATLVRANVTAEWWEKEITVLEKLISDIAFYSMEFDLSGGIIPELTKITL